MAKDTFYFSHDYHARKDPRCMALIKEFGATGYGIYWCLIEIMYEQGGRIKKFPALYSGLAYEFGIKEEDLMKQIEAMLQRYELLLQDDNFLWSASVLLRLKMRENARSTKSESGRLGGIKSGESRRYASKRSNASSKNEANEANEAKKSKGNERKDIKGVFFDQENFAVVLDDGTRQQLGNFQKIQLKNNSLKPTDIVKGLIT